ncbi:MAG TPA: molybdopterin cofactor-binding domain-containing protein [Jatrophihabitans sp.]|jgi:isoquinoline 1-oxidoreductase beta subunit|uniref:molybdopterin cofactor-binding domain-containing protein n=1 Tax=Jatrophihabitans sp. TaxID=1932789 RepID=UPI002E0977F0|nr:molybdopterin cofactor-binding domain-containing protein [Jatrophihabitans sp.]
MTATRRPTSDSAPRSGERARPLPYRRAVEVDTVPETSEDASGVRRRGFLSWAIAAPTLMVGTSLIGGLVDAQPAAADGVPSLPGPADLYDLGDLQDDAALPTSNLITIVVNSDGTATFAIPRAEVGQGITTSTSMIISEELDLPISKITVTLADARPELLFNQLTGGSNTTRSTYTAIRTAAALARGRLLAAAAAQWNVDVSTLTTSAGVVKSSTGLTATYGALTVLAAATTTTQLPAALKPASQFTVIGKPTKRVDALAAVTGQKQFTGDLKIPNALPTMIARPPTINGTPKSVSNLATVTAMPGVTDVAMISTGVAVRARTFGQCIDALRALDIAWNAGTEDGKSDATVLAELKAAEIPLAVPAVPLLTQTIEGSFTFNFRSNSPLETGIAIASWTPTGIEVWSPLKVPIVLQTDLAGKYGLGVDQVKVHVTTGGGSFGRHLFSDAAKEAVEASHAFGKPVKLMWSRTDDFRQGRTHPMATSRVRATYSLGNVLTYEQRHTSVSTDFTHGLGEILTAFSARLPMGNYTFAQSIWELTQSVSYNYGVTTQLLNEVDMGFNTGSMRNIYSPDARTAQELITDQIAKAAGKDPYQFRKAFLKNARGVAVLDKVAQIGNWGRTMPAGTAQGIAVHNEYKGWCAALVEIDTRPATVGRTVTDAYTGPRVTKVVFAVDVGLVINPTGLEAQMQGGIMDGIAQALTSSLHLKDGYFLEGSWDNYFYTRQWNVPDVQVIIMPSTSEQPGGAGEFGVAATQAAVACAYGRATGVMPTTFPINHQQSPSHFSVIPTVPSTPQSPTNGLTSQLS